MNENPAFCLIKLKKNPGSDRVLTEDEISRLLKTSRLSKNPYLYCVILLSLTTGTRQGEPLNLEWKHLDFQNKIAYIKESKNGRPRSIALCDPVIAELQRLHGFRNPQKSLVFASKTAFGRIDIKKAWQQTFKQAGITGCRAHDMRHHLTYLRNLSTPQILYSCPTPNPLERPCYIQSWMHGRNFNAAQNIWALGFDGLGAIPRILRL